MNPMILITLLIGLAGTALFVVLAIVNVALAIVNQAHEFPYPDKCWDCRKRECSLDCMPWEDDESL